MAGQLLPEDDQTQVQAGASAPAGMHLPGEGPEEQNIPAPKQEEPSMIGSFLSNLGANVDAIVAGHMQEQGDSRSRYAMQRAQRTSQEAALKEEPLSDWQKIGVQALDIGTGLGISAAGTAIGGPVVGGMAGGAYFGAEGLGNELRQQAQQPGFNQYDMDRAKKIALLQGVAGEVTGGITNKAVSYVAPKIARAVTSASEKYIPGLAGEVVVPKGVQLANHILGSKAGQAVTGGSATGGAMQMISNVGNDRDVFENVPEAMKAGGIAGAGIHGLHTTARTVLPRRMPTTTDTTNPDLFGPRGRYEPTPEGQYLPEEPIPRAANAEEGAMNPEQGQPAPQGAINPEEAIPGMQQGEVPPERVLDNPYEQQPGESQEQWAKRVYGNKRAWNIGTPGFGVHGGPNGQGPAGGPTSSIGTAAHGAVEFMKRLYNGGFENAVSPKGVKQMADTELTSRAQGMTYNPELVNNAKAAEGSLDVIQQSIEAMPLNSPERQQLIDEKTNMSAQSGSAAAYTRQNALALDSGMPMSGMYHNYTLTAGRANETNPKNIVTDYHNVPQSQVTTEHRAILESRGLNLPGSGEWDAEQRANFQTLESHHNATHEAYSKGKSKMNSMMRHNEETLFNALEPLRNTADPEWRRRVQDTQTAWKQYQELMRDASSGHHINVDEMQSVSRTLTDNISALGIHPEMKNIIGSKGTFDPFVDLEAWDMFNKNTRRMHRTAPTGSTKDEAVAKELGLADIDITKPFSFLKPMNTVGKQVGNRQLSAQSQARGATIARENALRPERAQRNVEEDLATGDTSAAQASAEEALNTSGINTQGPDLAATPAEEVHPASRPATGAQHAELARRGHPRAGAEDLTAGEADLHLAHGDMRTQQGQDYVPDNEAVSGMASRPEPPTEAPVAPEVVPEVAPEPTAPVEPTPGPFSENNVRPDQLPPEQTAEAAPEQTVPQGQGVPQRPARSLEEIAQEATPEPTVDVSQPVAPETIKAMSDGELYTNTGRASDLANQGDQNAIQNLNALSNELVLRQRGTEQPTEAPVTPSEPVSPEAGTFAQGNAKPAQKAPEEPVVEPTPEGQGVPQKPKAKPAEETVEEKPAAAEEAKTEEAKVEEPKAEEVKVEDLKINEPVPASVTDLREGETQEQRHERVAGMARQMIDNNVDSIIHAPAMVKGRPGGVTPEQRAEAVQLKQGIEEALRYAEKIARKRQRNTADIITALISREGGIEATFSEGYGKEAIKTGVRDAVTEYNAKMKNIAEGYADEAGNAIRRTLGERKIGRSPEEVEDLARANLIAMGFKREEIDTAVSRAKEVNPAPTVRQIAEHAKTLRRNAKKAKKSEETTSNEVNNLTEEQSKARQAADTASKKVESIKQDVEEAKGFQDKAEKIASKAGATEAQKKAARSAKKITDAEKARLDKVTAELEEHKTKIDDLQKQIDSANKTIADMEKAEKEASKKNAAYQAEQEARIDKMVQDHEAEMAKVWAEIKSDLRDQISDKPTEVIEQFGDVVGESLPSGARSVDDPRYMEWKAKLDVAAEELGNRNLKRHADFLHKLGRLVEKGMKYLEELPDNRELSMSGDDFNNLREAYQDMKTGGDSDLLQATSAQWGTMGQNIRRLLFGHSGDWRKPMANDELRIAREKVKFSKSDVGEGGIDSPGIKQPK